MKNQSIMSHGLFGMTTAKIALMAKRQKNFKTYNGGLKNMFGTSKIMLTGNVVKDSIIKDGKKGQFTVFTIAVNHSKDDCSFFDCLYFQPCNLRKGEFIEVWGKCKVENFKDINGIYHKNVKVIVDNVNQKLPKENYGVKNCQEQTQSNFETDEQSAFIF